MAVKNKENFVMFRTKYAKFRVTVVAPRYARYPDGTKYIDKPAHYVDFEDGVFVTSNPVEQDAIRKTEQYARNEVFELSVGEAEAAKVTPTELAMPCTTCGQMIQAKTMTVHKANCQGTNWVCSCGESFPSERALAAHRGGCYLSHQPVQV